MALTYSTMLPLGTVAPDFNLPGTDGKTYTLADFAGARALLVVFTCNHCPYAVAVEDRLITLARQFEPSGLRVVAINSNDATNYPADSFPNMQQRAREKAFPYPYLHDASQQVARAYAAACTPDPYLFDANLRLAYRGRIDDNWQDPTRITRQDLRAAIELVLAGQPAPAEQLASMGCNIKWKS